MSQAKAHPQGKKSAGVKCQYCQRDAMPEDPDGGTEPTDLVEMMEHPEGAVPICERHKEFFERSGPEDDLPF